MSSANKYYSELHLRMERKKRRVCAKNNYLYKYEYLSGPSRTLFNESVRIIIIGTTLMFFLSLRPGSKANIKNNIPTLPSHLPRQMEVCFLRNPSLPPRSPPDEALYYTIRGDDLIRLGSIIIIFDIACALPRHLLPPEKVFDCALLHSTSDGGLVYAPPPK